MENGMRWSFCMLPDYPLGESIEMIKTADELGYYGAYKPWADYLVEIDVGIWEERLNDENWAGWVNCKREISEVTLRHGGSITACHGATREGDADLVPQEMGASWEVVKRIKRALDPNNIMNPGKQSLDEAYEEER